MYVYEFKFNFRYQAKLAPSLCTFTHVVSSAHTKWWKTTFMQALFAMHKAMTMGKMCRALDGWRESFSLSVFPVPAECKLKAEKIIFLRWRRLERYELRKSFYFILLRSIAGTKTLSLKTLRTLIPGTKMVFAVLKIRFVKVVRLFNKNFDQFIIKVDNSECRPTSSPSGLGCKRPNATL